MAEEKTRPLSRERFKELLKFCGVNLFVIGVVISCRSQAQSDTFFQDAEVQYYFELFLFGFEILFNVALTFAILDNPPMHYLIPSLFIILGHGFLAHCMVNLSTLRLAIGEEKDQPPCPASSRSGDSFRTDLLRWLPAILCVFSVVAVSFWRYQYGDVADVANVGKGPNGAGADSGEPDDVVKGPNRAGADSGEGPNGAGSDS